MLIATTYTQGRAERNPGPGVIPRGSQPLLLSLLITSAGVDRLLDVILDNNYEINVLQFFSFVFIKHLILIIILKNFE